MTDVIDFDSNDVEIEDETMHDNVVQTRRLKRMIQDDKSCKGRCIMFWGLVASFLFKLQDFAIVFLTVITTAGVSLGFSVSTGDARLSMFYAVCAGTLIGSIFILGKMCIRARMGKAWVDVEVDSSNLVLILFLAVCLSLSIVLIVQLDKHCVGKPSLCNLQDLLSFSN